MPLGTVSILSVSVSASVMVSLGEGMNGTLSFYEWRLSGGGT